MRVRQKMSASVGDSKSSTRPSAAILCARGTMYAVCRTFGTEPLVALSRGIRMRAGFFRCRSAIDAMRGGSVAEKSAVCRVVGAASKISSKSSAKPMSSISSASSRTTVCRPERSSVPRRRWSSARPGVATTMCAPRLSARIWRVNSCPP